MSWMIFMMGLGAAFLFNRHLTKNDKWNFRMRYKMFCMISMLFCSTGTWGKRKKKTELEDEAQHKTSWMIFTMGAGFLFNRHLGEKNNNNKTDRNMRHKTTQDILDELHDGSSLFVQQAPEKEKMTDRTSG